MVAAATAIALNWTFWDRYLHAYTFQSFIDNPFPTIERLYPQERVKGVGRPSDIPVSEGSERTISDAALAEAVAFAEQSASTSLLVSHNGRLQLEKYWRGAGPEVPVYSFSMHKSVVALLVGIAIAEGRIGGVDDPLSFYLPQWSEDERGRISIRNLLQMNSGLEPMEFPRNPFSKHVRRQVGTDIAAAALSYRLQDEPGATFSYNGVNPTLLVMVLERATGKRYADLLSEKLWSRLGNRDAAVWLDRDGGLARGATSLYAVPRDW
ncbi:MAG: serine hydrolase domain-containing protein, partial [Gammaproteobacteria bacterium]